ncbi:phospho-N-acetylmuramoyl-pentapeptide-transferase [Anaerolineae bacterium CFX9]|jgi:phospho-N-acetylmuramoyl-pentapeptide-transferase|nr:phospho-N-acetylmuramoyl-pentapeptide-transferase [Anaerolineae bacterium CFX9]
MEQAGLSVALSVGLVAFLLGVIWGGPFVEVLKRLRVGKQIRVEISDVHQHKMGTPTMGGILIILPVIFTTLALNLVNLIRTVTGASILLPLFVMVGFALLGAYDDYEGIRISRGRRPIGEGISGRTKFAAQLVLALATATVISLYDGGFQFANQITIPLLGLRIPLSPVLFIPIAAFLIVGMSNAVNLTDGMDGLAGIITASAFAAYGVIAFLQGQIFLVQLCFIMVGACFAFLWYNAHPAQLFMGDVGSLALGATLATVAIMTGQWLLLPVIAIVPVVETVSVILQVLYYKATKGQRLFKRSPLHHHFELSGWSETQVVQRFWLVGLLAAIVGVALALA